MDTRWIVTGNAGRARIFAQANAAAPLEEIDDLLDDAVRLPAAETETDELGRRAPSTGTPRSGTPSPSSAGQPHTTPAEHRTELFARDVAAYLQEGHRQGRFATLSLVASPAFLGALRKALPPELAKVVGVEIDKDYSQATAAELRDRMARDRDRT